MANGRLLTVEPLARHSEPSSVLLKLDQVHPGNDECGNLRLVRTAHEVEQRLMKIMNEIQVIYVGTSNDMSTILRLGETS
ncbi:hypothetical protein SAY87_000440 [Trapa incisa]|uniref:Uncharacterized protein n=2 Tax=Trapa TaxID=22665 RepID=A0AAN7GRM5_9MYRT|nr:hypothetical protein SAY87_000440 [Trapa incisa]